MSEFTDHYDTLSKPERAEARKALEAELRAQLGRIYGRVWTRGKIAVEAGKMVDEAMRARKAAEN